ncbi:MAG TPA: PrsW family intramembrane metalloprotease [Polyangiaceae bacterium]|nr:PrsW family intramembrane metalloprotease [Polyangiaceae bacterium]
MFVLWFLAFLVIAPTVFVYFLIIKGADRYEPEPLWLLSAVFFWGAVVATVISMVMNGVGEGVLSAALSAPQNSQIVQSSTASFVAPFVEESAKGSGLLMLWLLSSVWLHEVDGPLDGAIYGGVLGLGFTLTEDVLYVGYAAAQGGTQAFALYLVRTVAAGLSHASFTAMTGLGVGVALETRSPALKIFAPIAGWLSAVGLHFVHNFLVTFLYDGGVGLLAKFLLFWTFDLLFFVLVVTLAVRDRSIVLRGLIDEVGRLLHPKELARTVSYWMFVPLWNFSNLMGSPGGYGASRKKQLALIELAFLKRRRARGVKGVQIDQSEGELRARVARANNAGVFIGAR